MNPVIVIATHKRVDMTIDNIELLLKQSLKPIIILSLTNSEEHHIFDDIFGPQINIIRTDNNPLGKKWQDAIEYHCHYANPLIICGSDDILGAGFIENACRLVEHGNHFIGLRRWWQHRDGRGYYCQYKAKDNQPIGGGRIYSAEMLKAINYQVFDPTKDKHLDDLGWQNARKSGLKCLVLEEPERERLSIHAIKGDWPVLNPFTLNHPNIKLLRSEKSEKILPSFFNQ